MTIYLAFIGCTWLSNRVIQNTFNKSPSWLKFHQTKTERSSLIIFSNITRIVHNQFSFKLIESKLPFNSIIKLGFIDISADSSTLNASITMSSNSSLTRRLTSKLGVHSCYWTSRTWMGSKLALSRLNEIWVLYSNFTSESLSSICLLRHNKVKLLKVTLPYCFPWTHY